MNPTTMPRWRTDDLYAGLNDSNLELDLHTLASDVTALERLFDELGVRKGGAPVTPDSLGRVLGALNAIAEQAGVLRSYLYAFVSTDSRDPLAQRRLSEFTTLTLPLGPLRTRLTAWLGHLDEDAPDEGAPDNGVPDKSALNRLLEASQVARDHAHLIRRAVQYARHQMTPPEEDLAARLRPSGAGGWAKLHSNLSSQLTGQYRGQVMPVTALRALASDPDEDVRRDAFAAELAAWQGAELVLSACLNGVKGEDGLLLARRGFRDPVEPSLLFNAIDRATLDAMQGAVVRSLPDFRRYLRAKARALGKASLDWWDLFAPVGDSGMHWSYEAGRDFVQEQFRAYSAALGEFGAQAFQEDWIDAGPRAGKRSGAFCMRWQGSKSRILMNHDPSLDSVSTLAHELGHGYHNLQLAAHPPLQRETPMTLAETASIFCETIIQNAALGQASGAQRLYALETQLMGHTQVVVDIHSRFLFEQAVYEKRRERELSAAEFNDLMTWAQRETYGDAIGTLHPYMWAVKTHYYGLPFYNYPYTFGLLFGLGLYAQYEQARAQGREAEFQASYDALLASTGREDARSLAARFGIDLHAPEFWEGSLNVIRGQIDAYEQAVAALN